MQPLYKYRPITRDLEKREIVRNSVIKVALRKQEKNSLTFDTFAAGKCSDSSALAMPTWSITKRKFGEGQEALGTLKIDILSDEVFRVRYAEEKNVPLNQTPMLNCRLSGPKKCKIKIENVAFQISVIVEGGKEEVINKVKKHVIIETAKVRVVIESEPYRMIVTDLKGKKLCGISGNDKNHFGTWDNIGTSNLPED